VLDRSGLHVVHQTHLIVPNIITSAALLPATLFERYNHTKMDFAILSALQNQKHHHDETIDSWI
jgi:hypothetical protein